MHFLLEFGKFVAYVSKFFLVRENVITPFTVEFKNASKTISFSLIHRKKKSIIFLTLWEKLLVQKRGKQRFFCILELVYCFVKCVLRLLTEWFE